MLVVKEEHGVEGLDEELHLFGLEGIFNDSERH